MSNYTDACEQAGNTLGWIYVGKLNITSHPITRRIGDPWYNLDVIHWIRAWDPLGIDSSLRYIGAGSKPITPGGNDLNAIINNNDFRFWYTTSHNYKNATELDIIKAGGTDEFKNAFNLIVAVAKSTVYTLNL